MSVTTPNPTADWKMAPNPLRCPDCGGSFVPDAAGLACAGCGRVLPIRDGILVVKDEPTADNLIARDFYNSSLWPKFRFWEWFFFVCNGGERRSRNVILKHLPQQDGLRLLDVAIGDGVYHSWLPRDWNVVGIDVSTSQLAACQRRNAGRDLRLILGEAETLPFQDHSFDAILSIGGFNHFNDPEASLREMVRVARPGAPIVISDESPNLTDRMIGHKLGMPAIDRWVVSRLMNLGDAFTDLVERNRHINIAEIGQRVLKDSQYQVIWRGGGYVMVGQAP
ncbi:Methyltransferase domain-containing protein [Singulisphaera sp. GP187]|uniref:methyltransferase domain-containing protein n=1 Tax=Singulisphaera sp. GP187 TaxID=1882752 RepID=UPI000928180C|nr:methyltransferase domain-containing protein [Singulisphaera sp. GP187]SIN90109.1 Methyltransferase domain-containing protein [Singulisphaera sp. GP187]